MEELIGSTAKLQRLFLSQLFIGFSIFIWWKKMEKRGFVLFVPPSNFPVFHFSNWSLNTASQQNTKEFLIHTNHSFVSFVMRRKRKDWDQRDCSPTPPPSPQIKEYNTSDGIWHGIKNENETVVQVKLTTTKIRYCDIPNQVFLRCEMVGNWHFELLFFWGVGLRIFI